MKRRVKHEDDAKAIPIAQNSKGPKKGELSANWCDTKVETKLEEERNMLETKRPDSTAVVTDSRSLSTGSVVSVSTHKKESDEEKPITFKEENHAQTGDYCKKEHALSNKSDATNSSTIKPEDDDDIAMGDAPTPVEGDNAAVNEAERFDSPESESKLSTRSTSTAAQTHRTGSTIDDAIELSDDDDEDVSEVQRPADVFCEVIELSSDSEDEDERPIRRLPSTPLRSGVRAGPPEVIEIEDSDDEDNKPPIDYEAYMKGQEHPKFKVKKKEDLQLPPDIAGPRLMAIAGEPFVPDPPPPPGMIDTVFPRIFTTNTYGGNTQDTCPKIAPEKLAKHGMDDWMFLNLECNPHAPQFVGADGLCFGVGTGRAPERPGIFRVVSRIQSNRWMYVGQYRLEPSDSLSPREWSCPSMHKFRTKWIEMVLNTKWSTSLRTYVALRKRLGREPSVAEREDASDALASSIREKDIRQAFASGWLCITVRTMKCVDYEVDFLRNLVAKLEVWVPPPPKKKGNSRSKKPVKSEPKESSLGKRRRAVVVKVKAEDDGYAEDSEAEAPPPKKKVSRMKTTSAPKRKKRSNSSDDEMDADEDEDFRMSTPQDTPIRKYALRARK